MKILVTGASGQLGHSFAKVSSEYPHLNIFCADRQALDLSDSASVQSAIEIYAPEFIVNAAAFTDVDGAESQEETAMKINGEAVGILATACEKISAGLLQISTDYVFDGENTQPYQPDDTPWPINVYGQSKLLGEKLALAACSRTRVVRTSWLYSDYGKNFANSMRRLFTEREELRIVHDQIGRPTHSDSLARYCLDHIGDELVNEKIFHHADKQIMSWYDFARKLWEEFEGEKKTKRILPITSDEYPTKATRPKYSVLALAGEKS